MADQASERISLLRAPVLSAMSTTGYKSELSLRMQASSNRWRSSSKRNRTLPGGSLGLPTCSTGLKSIHCHSRRATANAWLSSARYRLTVAAEWASANSSRHSVTTAGLTAESRRWPILRCHQSSCCPWLATVERRLCGNMERRYLANSSSTVKRLVEAFGNCCPSRKLLSIRAAQFRASVKRRKLADCCGAPRRRTWTWYTFSPRRFVRSRIVAMSDTISVVPKVCHGRCPHAHGIPELLYFQVPPRGLEPLTLGLEVRCSIQLS